MDQGWAPIETPTNSGQRRSCARIELSFVLESLGGPKYSGAGLRSLLLYLRLTSRCGLSDFKAIIKDPAFIMAFASKGWGMMGDAE